MTYYSNRKLTDLLIQENIEGRIAGPAESIALSSEIYTYNTYMYMYSFVSYSLLMYGPWAGKEGAEALEYLQSIM